MVLAGLCTVLGECTLTLLAERFVYRGRWKRRWKILIVPSNLLRQLTLSVTSFLPILFNGYCTNWVPLKFRFSQPEQQQFLDSYGLVPDMQICGRSSVE